MYATSLNLSFRHPFTGLGIGVYRSLAAESLVGFGSVLASAGAGVLAPHNSVLMAAAESGWIAALALVGAFAGMIWFALQSFRATRGWVAAGLLGMLACYVANSLLFDAQLQVHSAVVLALVIGPLIGHLSHDVGGTEAP
jgi:O-antigen ligase